MEAITRIATDVLFRNSGDSTSAVTSIATHITPNISRRLVANAVYGPCKHDQHNGETDWMPQVRMLRAHTVAPRNVLSCGFRAHWTSPTVPLPDARSAVEFS